MFSNKPLYWLLTYVLAIMQSWALLFKLDHYEILSCRENWFCSCSHEFWNQFHCYFHHESHAPTIFSSQGNLPVFDNNQWLIQFSINKYQNGINLTGEIWLNRVIQTTCMYCEKYRGRRLYEMRERVLKSIVYGIPLKTLLHTSHILW